MYLKRKIDTYLSEWKKTENRLPLIIKGARQIGKTESIKHFAEQTCISFEKGKTIAFGNKWKYIRFFNGK